MLNLLVPESDREFITGLISRYILRLYREREPSAIFSLVFGGTPAYWSFRQDGVAQGVAAVDFLDERLKDIDAISEPLEKMRLIRGQTWEMEINRLIWYRILQLRKYKKYFLRLFLRG